MEQCIERVLRKNKTLVFLLLLAAGLNVMLTTMKSFPTFIFSSSGMISLPAFLLLLTMVSMMMAWLLLECAFKAVKAVVLHQSRAFNQRPGNDQHKIYKLDTRFVNAAHDA